MSKDKKKKQKTVYIDDGRTIADMSALYGKKPHSSKDSPRLRGRRGTLKEQGQTFFAAQKMMFLPMLTMIGGICVIFAIIYLILSLAS